MTMFTKLASAAALSLALAAPAGATLITYTLNDEYSGGATPLGTFTATFDDTACGADCVQLTMSATGPDTNEFLDNWAFNFDPNKDATLISLVFTPSSGVPAGTSISITEDGFKMDGGNLFDILIGFPQPNASRFNVGDPNVVFNITAAGLTANDFDFLAAADTGNGGGLHSAAHVQGIAAQPGSGWITDNGGGGPGGNVPEPGALWLFGAAALALGFVRMGRRAN